MANNNTAYGFTKFSHLGSERLTDRDTAEVFTAIEESAAEHTKVLNEMLSSFVERTTLHQTRFKLPGSYELQPLTPSGVPLPVRPVGYFDVAFPIRDAGTAWADDRVARAMMTLQEANRLTLESLRADAAWMRRHILAAIFSNTTWDFVDPVFGTLTIQPLANTDGTLYPVVGGGTEDSEHYLAQAAAIGDSDNPYDNIFAQLSKHPSNSGPFVAYIATDLVTATKALTNFIAVRDPDIEIGIGSDRITGTIDAIRGWGHEVLGKTDDMWIVEQKNLPSTYIIGHAVGAGPAVAMREHPSASLQGLQVEAGVGNGNLKQTNMFRNAGFGVQNRVAVVVQRTGNGSYGIPSGFDTPIPR